MNKTEEKLDRYYIAVLRYEDKKPIFHKEKIIVSASDIYSAMAQLNLKDIQYVDLIGYQGNDKLYPGL